MDAFSIAISIALQYGVPLETYIQKFTNMRFEPAGMTDDPDIRIAQSVMDYIFRRLALDHLPVEQRAKLGIFTAEERAAQVAGYGYGSTAAPARRRRGGGRRRGAARLGADRAPAHEAARPRPTSRSRRRTPRRAARAGHRQRHRRAAVHDLRHEDAPGRQLLRLRGLRLHQRAAQVSGTYGGSASTADVVEEEVDLEALRGSAPTDERKPDAGSSQGNEKSIKEAHSSAELLELVTGTATDAPLARPAARDAPRRQLLRLRGLRLHQRLQLMTFVTNSSPHCHE